jgi:hypothetical protein
MKLKDSREIIGKDYPTGLILLGLLGTQKRGGGGSQLLIQHRLNEMRAFYYKCEKYFYVKCEKDFITNMKKTFITNLNGPFI